MSEEKLPTYLNLMPAFGKRLSHPGINAILHLHVASSKRMFRKPRRLERSLNIHPKIHHIRHKLRVRLRLIESAHNSKRNPLIASRHKSRNDRMQRPLVPRQRIR